MNIRRVVVAAPASGHGKTSIATGLMGALRARGLSVSGHKVGPDYIDPGYHALATGRPGRNLDPYLQGEDRVVPLFLHGALTPAPADIAVVEGVMGLFDGAVGQEGFASTAHVAALLRAPVLLVVDASASGRSVAALVHGFATYDDRVRLGGVVLNKVGSDRHEAETRSALDSTGVPVLGVVRRDGGVTVPSRHLGLVPAAEHDRAAVEVVDRLAALVAGSVDIDAVLRLASGAPSLTGSAWTPGEQAQALLPGAARPVVALAGGAAFTFSYTETAELLTAAGCDVTTVDPLHDEALPPGTSALVIGGGFPEVHAAALSENALLRKDVAALALRGGTVLAECAGLLYLAQELDGHPMCGVLPASARMTAKLTLGYRTAVALTRSVMAEVGERVTGHEFHRTSVDPRAGDPAIDPAVDPRAVHPAWGWTVDGQPQPPEGFVRGAIHASYLHVHWAGHPAIAQRLARQAAGSATHQRMVHQ